MSLPVISVENLSKRYVIGHQNNAREGLRHTLENAVRNPFKWLQNRKEHGGNIREEFWALKNVSFEVGQGQVVGVIGRNGAGKSTLLKVLSRITEPTTGRIRINGRIASLLEVGTGFHQELTGRENIFLNGAILGMTKMEIKRKFDEIVAFSEVEKFLDTPVKRYSSGMYVRLAFAVAAHLDPDILILDEVLAVGDSQFQKKCLGKMEDVAAAQGRTVLFVSHNMGMIARLCKHSLLLEGGRVVAFGPTADVVSRYLRSGAEAAGRKVWSEADTKSKNAAVRLREILIVNSANEISGHVDITKPFTVEMRYQIVKKVPMFRMALRFFTSDGTLAFTAADSGSPDFADKPTVPGSYVTRCVVPGNLLNEGQYFITVSGDIPFQQVVFNEESVIGFTVEQTGGVSSRFPEKWPGAVCPSLEWSTRACPSADNESVRNEMMIGEVESQA
jgi:lipopolysaccharide transport system ATP-binding protein